MTSRDDVLAQIRDAIGAGPASDPQAEYAAIARGYLRTPRFTREERLRLFASRLEDYDCDVFMARADTVAQTIASVLATRDRRRLVAPRGFPSEYLPADLAVSHDDQLPALEIETLDGVLTSCAAAIAFTGSIVLTHSAAEGRRVLTLLPDYHLCVVPEDRIVDSLPEALTLIRNAEPSLITTISGPSATADIEMTRIRGVHGPRTLDVVILAS
jgi:L-lactate dehydrogenase complex protein LldG